MPVKMANQRDKNQSITQLRIATRRSALALWQANFVKQQLEVIHPYLNVELLPITRSAGWSGAVVMPRSI